MSKYLFDLPPRDPARKPYAAYPVINLSGIVTFDDWTISPSGKLKIKKGN